jgi:MFS family permease
MQNILHYSPLQAGVRFLPATVVIIVMGPLAGRLTDRIGPRPLITAGLAVVASALFIQSQLTIHTGYGLLLPGFVLMGLGMGLVMSPMSTAAMNSVDRTKAGVASGVLSMSRMVGGTFGVAVMGALITTIGRSQIDQHLPQLPAATRAAIANSLGGGGTVHASPQVVATVREAFVSALGTGLTIGAIVTLVGGVAAWTLIRSTSSARADTSAERQADASVPAEIAA